VASLPRLVILVRSFDDCKEILQNLAPLQGRWRKNTIARDPRQADQSGASHSPSAVSPNWTNLRPTQSQRPGSTVMLAQSSRSSPSPSSTTGPAACGPTPLLRLLQAARPPCVRDDILACGHSHNMARLLLDILIDRVVIAGGEGLHPAPESRGCRFIRPPHISVPPFLMRSQEFGPDSPRPGPADGASSQRQSDLDGVGEYPIRYAGPVAGPGFPPRPSAAVQQRSFAPVDPLLIANTTASGRETRRASSDPACNRWQTA
jgi:hypothetical protein